MVRTVQCHRNGRSSQAVDPAQDRGEQCARHRHLGELEHHIAAVAHDPGADFTSFSRKRGQRPLLDLLRQRQRAEEIGEVVGRPWRRGRTALWRPARQGRRVRAARTCLADPLLRGAAAVA